MSDGKNEAASDKEFLCGVIEGFYGKPWTVTQRHELFVRMKRFGMNTFMYAPKDDYKHRRCWRQLYSKSEADGLKKLIESAEAQKIDFVYALSPGLDMIYSNAEENLILKRKLDQIKGLGCKYFALLFDDIENELTAEDSVVFPSFAHAQCKVTNDMYEYLNKPRLFLFCPTEYCTSRAVPTLKKSSYLKTVGEKLNENIEFLWTGPKVVSRQISVDGIDAISAIVKRKVTIWDNIHANDYDQTRLFIGPFSGRSTDLIGRLRGVLTNPNCEFHVNFIACHTLAQWSKNTCTRFPVSDSLADKFVDDFDDDDMEYDDDDDKEPSNGGYKPRRALYMAARDWLPELYRIKSSCSDECNDDIGVGVVDPGRAAGAPSDKLMSSDLVFLSNFFYLPHENGPDAVRLIRCARWLVDNVPSVIQKRKTASLYQAPPTTNHTSESGSTSEPSSMESSESSGSSVETSRSSEVPSVPQNPVGSEREWYSTARRFHEGYGDLSAVVDRICDIPNRELLYEVYHYINDMRSSIALVNSFIKWLAVDGHREPFKSGEQEPWVHRGGLLAEFRRILPIDGRNDEVVSKSSQTSEQVFIIRPYRPDDMDKVYEVVRRSCDDRKDGGDSVISCPRVPGDCVIGAFLKYYPQLCYVLEDEYGVIGYAGAADSVVEYNKRVSTEYLTDIKSSYSSQLSNDNKDHLSPQTMVSLLESTVNGSTDELTRDYSAVLSLSVLPTRVVGNRMVERLLDTVLGAVRCSSAEVKGVHVNVPVHHHAEQDLFKKLDFTPVPNSQEGIMSFVTLAKSIK